MSLDAADTSVRATVPRVLAALLLAFFLYFFRIGGTGLVSTDEPRYAAIGREMARSGDWITPRLWGSPWFEKSALLYWMTGAGFRLGLDGELAPRLPVALLSVAFLAFFYCWLRKEFGARPALYATAILGTSAGWLAYSYVAVTDLPMSVFFSASMLLGMTWLRTGARRWLIAAAAALGFAVLAKSFVPLVLAIPFAWAGRRKMREMLNPAAVLMFLAVAAPWYILCYARNGAEFWRKLFWEQQVSRIASPALQHVQPVWYYAPVFAAALFPWTPVLALLFRRRAYADERRVLLLAWIVFGLLFFSVAINKLPGYILPLLPPAAALMGLALAEGRSRWALSASAAALCLIGPVAALLPQVLAVHFSRAHLPAWSFLWLAPLVLIPIVWRAQRTAAVCLIGVALTVGIVYVKVFTFPAIDLVYSARPLWRRLAESHRVVCVDELTRDLVYGFNYYSGTLLPACDPGTTP